MTQTPDHTELIATLPTGERLERVADIIRSRAATSPDHVAIRTADRTSTFAELDATSSRIGQALIAEGVRPGDRVAYIGGNSPDFLAVLYGAAKAGAIATAVNTLLAEPEITSILDDAEPCVVIVGTGDERCVPGALAARTPRRVVSTTTTPLDDWIADHPAQDPHADAGGDATALVLYSSGTTGHPKGVMLTGHNVAAALSGVQNLLELNESSVAMAPIPFFHISGLGLALVATLVGAELIVLAPTDPEGLIRDLEQYRVSHAVVVPTVIQRLLSMPETLASAWPHLRYVIYGASPIPAPLLRQAIDAFGCKFVQSYGLTESSGGVTILDHADHQRGLDEPRLLTSAGRPLPGVGLQITDPHTQTAVAPGDRGEIWLSGRHTMAGYWQRPEATATAFHEDWLRTGDIGLVDDEGYLFIVDRLKDMLISGGENVYPAEVERVLSDHPAIAECAVIGVASAEWGESPVAVVVRTPGTDLSEAELIAWSRERLAPFKRPTAVSFIEALPRNASGKILKQKISAPATAASTTERN